MEDNLPAQITASGASDNRVRLGVFNATLGKVEIQGTPVNAGALESAGLIDGDNVAVIRQDKTWLVLGRVTDLAGLGWGNPPLATLRQTAAQSIPNNTSTPVSFTVMDQDTADGWSLGQPTRYTAQLAGTYQVSGGCSFAASAAGVRTLQWRRNGGANELGTGVLNFPAAADTTRMAARTHQFYLGLGDFVELIAFQNSGGPLNTAVANVEQASMVVQFVSRSR